MKIETTNKRIRYRNGKFGFLLTTTRPNTSYCVLTMVEDSGCIIHHTKDGEYLGGKEKNPWDIISVGE